MKKLLLASCALLGTSFSAYAEDVTLRLSHWLPPQHSVPMTGIKPWTDSITEASNGSIKFEIFPAQQLGSAPDHYDMTRDGIADIGYINPGYTAGRFPIYELTGVPFEASSGVGGAKAIHEWYQGTYADKEMGDVYFCLVNPHEPGRLHGKDPIRVPADIAGLSVRPAHSTMARFVNSLGGSSVQVPAPEAREAVARGTADAVTLPYEAMEIFKLKEVTTFHNDLPLYLSAQVMLFNRAKYDGLSADQKAVIDAHCTPDWSAKFSEGWAEYDAGVRQAMIDDPNHEVYSPSEAEVDLWKKAAEPVLDAWKADATAAGMDADKILSEYRAALDANNAKY